MSLAGDSLRTSIKCHTDWNNQALKDIGYAVARLLDKEGEQVSDLLGHIHQYDKVIQAVATALGGVCCGGIDVEGPGSTERALVGAIEALNREVAGMSNLAFTRLETLNKRTDELHLLRARCEQRGLSLQDAEARIRELTILAGENLP